MNVNPAGETGFNNGVMARPETLPTDAFRPRLRALGDRVRPIVIRRTAGHRDRLPLGGNAQGQNFRIPRLDEPDLCAR